MNSSNNCYLNRPFSHIYIEKEAADYAQTKRVLSALPHAQRVMIDHYKDLFCRSRQDWALQKQSPSLILAKQAGALLHPGASVCQSFGNRWFYYTSMVMNCIYDCEYCYLQGMYPSANLVVFVNTEDLFARTKELLAVHPVYLCISYDTDLLAMEGLLGFVEQWAAFSADKESLTLEVRTKSANEAAIRRIPFSSNLIFAWTLSPESVIRAYEHKTSSLDARLSCAKAALERGFPVRLCFDPLIDMDGWEDAFDRLIADTSSMLPLDKVLDFSIGTFRISKEYLKQLRRSRPRSPLVWDAYEETNGVLHYPSARSRELTAKARKRLADYVPEERIFLWESGS